MKKYLVAFVLFGLFAVTPVFAATNAENQSLWEKLLSLTRRTDSLQQTAATVVGQKSITATPVLTTGTTPITPVDEISNTRGCEQTLTPFGTINQTIRCNGTSWVAAGNLLNDGVSLGIGGISPHARFNVEAVDNGSAISIIGRNSFDGGLGVAGRAFGEDGIGVDGRSTGSRGIGVYGEVSGENSYGLRGESSGSSGVGVYGGSPFGTGVAGKSTSGTGIRGTSEAGVGVNGYSSGSTGVFGKSAAGENGVGVFGEGPNDNYGIGVRGRGVTGVEGEATSGSGLRVGVKGTSQGPNNVAVLGSIGGPDSNSETSIAVKASTIRTSGGIGFYQEGVNAKNNLEGTLSVGYVNPGNLAPGVSAQMSGGLRIFPNTGAVRPACSNASNTRGTFWVSLGASGASDSVEVCLRNADGSYSWRNVF